MKKTLLAVLVMCAAFSLNAKGFCLQIIQKNTPGDEVFDTSYVVEQTILDYFFERGMIVTNNSVLVSKNDEKADSKDVLRSLIEAKIGCMDLFVKLSLNFTLEESMNPTAVLLSNIKNADIEILSVESRETLVKGTYSPKAVTDTNNNRVGVESFANDIAMDIQARLDKKGGAK